MDVGSGWMDKRRGWLDGCVGLGIECTKVTGFQSSR
jgi:hypothetical protein